MVDFLFALTQRFRHLLRFRSYEAKCVQLGCFHSGRPLLHSNFAWTRSSPTDHSWHRKSRDTGLPDDEDHIRLRSIILHDTGVCQTNGRTDRQTDMPPLPCKTSFAARCNKIINKSSRVDFIETKTTHIDHVTLQLKVIRLLKFTFEHRLDRG